MARRKKTAAGAGRSNIDIATFSVILAFVLATFLFDSSARDPFLAIRMVGLSLWAVSILVWMLASHRPLSISSRAGRVFLWLGLGFWAVNLASLWPAANIQESLLFLARYGLHLVLAFLLLALLSEPGRQARLLARFLTAALLACALAGIGQYYQAIPFEIPGSLPPTGFSGNRNLFGSFLVLLLPWSVYCLFQDKGAWRAMAVAAIAFGGYALVLSQTRSAWLAFVLMVLSFQLLLFVHRQRFSAAFRKQWRNALLAGALGIVAAIGLAFAGGKGSQLASSLKWRVQTFFQLPAQDAEPGNEAERNAQERIYVWRHTVDMVKEHPLLGVGAGNWRVRFPEYGGSSAPSFEGIDQMRIRPHNVYLGIASEAGLLALLLYLALGALALAAAWKAARRAKDEAGALLAILLFSGLLASAVDLAFSFPTERMEHNLLLLLYSALALNLASGATPSVKPAKWQRNILAAALFALLGFSLWIGWQKWQLDRKLQEILRLETRGNFELAARLSEEAEGLFFRLDPIGDPIQWHSANAYKQLKQMDKALAKAEEAERYQPNSHRVLNTKASILMGLERYADAVPVLQKTVQLAPHYEPALINLAYCLYRTDQYEACIQTLEKLDLEQNPKLKLIQADAGYKMEMAALEQNPMYQIGLQLAPEWKASGQVSILPAATSFYQQRASDEAFVQDYFNTLGAYCRAKAWQRGDSAEQVQALSQKIEQARDALLASAPANELARNILHNNHFRTVAHFLQSPSDSGNDGAGNILFPMNE